MEGIALRQPCREKNVPESYLVKVRLWTLADGGEEDLLQIAATHHRVNLPF